MKGDATRWERICQWCLGNKCDACNEIGWIPEKETPVSLLTADAGDLFDAYRIFRNYQVLPVAGAWADQTVSFHDTVRLCDMVTSLYMERNAKQKEFEDKADEAIQRIIGNR